MSAESPHLPADAYLLYEYLGRQLEHGGERRSGSEVIADLASYQEQLERLRTMIREGEKSLDRGEGRELDLDALLLRVRQRISSQSARS